MTIGVQVFRVVIVGLLVLCPCLLLAYHVNYRTYLFLERHSPAMIALFPFGLLGWPIVAYLLTERMALAWLTLFAISYVLSKLYDDNIPSFHRRMMAQPSDLVWIGKGEPRSHETH